MKNCSPNVAPIVKGDKIELGQFLKVILKRTNEECFICFNVC